MKRSSIVILLVVGLFGIAGLGYFVWSPKDNPSPTELSVELMPGSVAGEPAASSALSETEDPDAGSDVEAIEKLMLEIEKTAAGDEGALESEYAAESESFMEGAVVMEQLGTSYDETSY
jgi:hypothetical protein